MFLLNLVAVALPATAIIASVFVLYSRGSSFLRCLALFSSAALLGTAVGLIQFSFGASTVGYCVYFGTVAGVFFTVFVLAFGWCGKQLELYPNY